MPNKPAKRRIPARLERRGCTFWIEPHSRTNVRVCIIGDVHLPFHDPAAVELALRIIRYVQPHFLILNGDIVDFHGISRFPVTPIRRLQFPAELRFARRWLRWLREQLPDVVMIYLAGNHEERLRSYLWRKAQELSEIDALRLPELLGLRELGIHFAETETEPRGYSDFVAAQVVLGGRLYVLHGHSIRTSGSVVNVARTVFHRTFVPMLIGHWHRTQHHEETSYDGSTSGCWVVGCLCYPRPHYDAGRIWGQGMAVVHLRDQWFRPTLVSFFRRDNHLHAFHEGTLFSVDTTSTPNVPIWEWAG